MPTLSPTGGNGEADTVFVLCVQNVLPLTIPNQKSEFFFTSEVSFSRSLLGTCYVHQMLWEVVMLSWGDTCGPCLQEFAVCSRLGMRPPQLGGMK